MSISHVPNVSHVQPAPVQQPAPAPKKAAPQPSDTVQLSAEAAAHLKDIDGDGH